MEMLVYKDNSLYINNSLYSNIIVRIRADYCLQKPRVVFTFQVQNPPYFIPCFLLFGDVFVPGIANIV